MAAKKKPPVPAKLSASDETLLGQGIKVTSGTAGGVEYRATKAQLKTLLEYAGGPLVEINPAELNAPDNVAVLFRATPVGVTMNGGSPAAQQQPAQAFGQQQPAEATTETEPDFIIEEGIEVPALKRGGRGASARKYPFETMGLKASFFIPKSEENPKPAKRIASVVSHASKTLAPKKFKVQAVTETAKITATNPTGEGARIWRME
jgi:hypothetical protein